ncbi:MAG: hypothetical protein J6N47_09150 [Lachnospiraceae bacterium]|nr:hypothetical protein [Lachnospiraceae bacterium]
MYKAGDKVNVTIDGVQKEIVILPKEELDRRREKWMREYDEAEEMSHRAMMAWNQMDRENMTLEEIAEAMKTYYQKKAY